MSFIDEQVVKMTFDNDGFERGVSDTITSLEKLNGSIESLGSGSASSALENLQHSIDQINFEDLNRAIDTVNDRFSALGVATARIIEDLTDKIVNMGESLVTALTVKSPQIGFSEYNQVMNISKVLQANTTATTEEIEKAVKALQTYADRTIFNFGDLTKTFGNWGTLVGDLSTNGVEVEKLVEGLSNLTALSGKSTSEMSALGGIIGRSLAGSPMNRRMAQMMMTQGVLTKDVKLALEEAVKKVGDYDKYLRAMSQASGNLVDAVSPNTARGNSDWWTTDVMIEFLNSYAEEGTARGEKAKSVAADAVDFPTLVNMIYERFATGWSEMFKGILGNVDEAKELWGRLGFYLLGDDEVTGVLAKPFDDLGNFFQAWGDLGGRAELIDGLFDAFDGLRLIVESVGLVFESLFPWITPESFKEFTSDFSEGARKFREWAENLRSYFGTFTSGWDWWKEQVTKTETVTERREADEEVALNAQLNYIMNKYGDIVKQFFDKFNYPEYVKQVKDNSEAGYHFSTDVSKITSELNSFFKDSNKDDDDGTQAALAASIAGIENDVDKGFYINGVRSAEFYDQYKHDLQELSVYIEILKDAGINIEQELSDVVEGLATYEDVTHTETYPVAKKLARIVQGSDYNVDSQGTGTDQTNLLDTLYGIAAALRLVADIGEAAYSNVIAPMFSSIITGAASTLLIIVGDIGDKIYLLYERIANSGVIQDFFSSIYDFVVNNTDLNSFFSTVSAVFLTLNDIIFTAINGLMDLGEFVAQSDTFQTILGFFRDLWGFISPLISNNIKTGGVIGGFLGALKGAIGGFFSGGPIGMLIGLFKGFTGGAAKGGLFGVVIDVLKYLENNAPKVIILLSQLGTIVSQLVSSFVTGFSSKATEAGNTIFGAITNFIEGFKNGSFDPLDALIEFFSSDAIQNGIDGLKKKFESLGEWFFGVVEFFKGVGSDIVKAITDAFNFVTGKSAEFKPSFENIKNFGPVSFILELGGIIKDAVVSLFGWVTVGGESILNFFKNLDISKKADSVTGFFGGLAESLKEFRQGDTFAKVKEWLSGIGESFRDIISLFANGTITGVIFDFFRMLGSLGGGLFEGLFGLVKENEQIENVKSVFAGGLEGIKERFDAFLESDSFNSLREKFVSIGTVINDFVNNAIAGFNEHFPKISEGFEFIATTITSSDFISIITNVRDLIIDLVTSFTEGLTGTPIKDAGDGVKTLLSTIDTALSEFKASEKYKSILDLFKEIGDFISKLPGYISGFFTPITKETTKAVKTEEKQASLFDNLFGTVGGFFGSLIFGTEVSAAELAAEDIAKATNIVSEAMTDGAETLTKSTSQVSSTVLYGRDLHTTQTGFATLKTDAETAKNDAVETAKSVKYTGEAIGEASIAVVEASDQAGEATGRMSILDGFVNGLSAFGDIMGSLRNVFTGGTILSVVLGAIGIMHLFTSLVSIFGNINLYLLSTVIKQIGVVLGILAASVIGIAYMYTREGGPEAIDAAFNYVARLTGLIGAIAIVLEIVANLSQGASVTLGKANMFDSITKMISGLFESFKTLISTAGIIAGVIAAVGGIILIINTVAKLGAIDTDRLKVIWGIVATLTGIFAAVLIVLNLFNSIYKDPVTNFNPLIIAAPILALGISIKMIIDSIASMTALVNTALTNDKSAEALAAATGIVVAIGAILIVMALLFQEVLSNPGTIIDTGFKKLLGYAVVIFGLGYAISEIVDAVGDLYNILKDDESGIVSEQNTNFVLKSLLGIAGIILALSFVVNAMNKSGTNAVIDVKAGTGWALIGMVLAIKLLIGSIADLAQKYSELQGAGDILSMVFSIITIVALLAELALSASVIGKNGSGGARFSNGPVLIAMMLSLAGIIFTLVQLAKSYEKLGNENGFMSGFLDVLGALITIIAVMGSLALAVGNLETDKDKKSGFGNAVGVFIMAQGIISLVNAAEKMMGHFSTEKGEGLKTALLWIVGLIAEIGVVLGAVNWTQGEKDDWTKVVFVAGLLGGLYFVLSMLYDQVNDVDKLTAITGCISVLLGVIGGLTLLANTLGQDGINIKALATGMEKMLLVAGGFTTIFTGIFGLIGYISDKAEQHNKNDVKSIFTWLASVGETAGDAIISLAGFIGDIVAEFKKHAFVDNSESAIEAMGTIGETANALSESVEGVDVEKINHVIEVIGAITELAIAITEAVTANPANFVTFGKTLGDQIAPAIETFMNNVDALYTKSFPGDSNNGFADAIALIKALSSSFGDNDTKVLKTRLTNVGEGVKAFVDNVYEVFKTGFFVGISEEEMKEKVNRLQLLTDLFNGIGWMFENVNGINEDGANLIRGLIAGILSLMNLISPLGEDAAKAFMEGFQEEADEHSPSLKTYMLGHYLMEGLANGITDMLKPIEQLGALSYLTFAKGFNKNKLNLTPNDTEEKPKNVLLAAQYDEKTLKDFKVGDARKVDSIEDAIMSMDDLANSNNLVTESMNDMEKKAEEIITSIEAIPEDGSYEDYMNALGYGDSWFGKYYNEAMDTLTNSNGYLQQGLGWVSDKIGAEISKYTAPFAEGGDLNPKNLLSGLEEDITNGVLHSLSDLIGMDVSEKDIEKLINGELFNSWMGDSIFGQIFDDESVFKNILFSSDDTNELLTNIQTAMSGFDLSGLSTDDLTSALSEFSNEAHYMGGDIDSSVLNRIDKILGIESDSYDSYEDVAKQLQSSMSGITDSLGVGNTNTEEMTNLMNKLVAGEITMDEYSDMLNDITKSQTTGQGTTTTTATPVKQEPAVDPKITELAYRVIRGDFGNNPDRQRLLEEAGYSYEVIQNEVNRLLGNSYRYITNQEDINRTLESLGGATVRNTEDSAEAAKMTNQTVFEAYDATIKQAQELIKNSDNQEIKDKLQNAIDLAEERYIEDSSTDSLKTIINDLEYSINNAKTNTDNIDSSALNEELRIIYKKIEKNGYITRRDLEELRSKNDVYNFMTPEIRAALDEAVKEVGDYDKYLRAMNAANGNVIDAVSQDYAGSDSDWFTPDVTLRFLDKFQYELVDELEDTYYHGFLNKFNNNDPNNLQIIKSVEEQLPTTQNMISDLMQDLNNANGHLDKNDYAAALEQIQNVYDSAKELAEKEGYVFGSTKARKAMEDAEKISELATKGIQAITDLENGGSGADLEQRLFGTQKNLKRTVNTTLAELASQWPELTESIQKITNLTNMENYKDAFIELGNFSRKLEGKATALNSREVHNIENELLKAESRLESGQEGRAGAPLLNASKSLEKLIYGIDTQTDGIFTKIKTKTTEEIEDLNTQINDLSDTLLENIDEAESKVTTVTDYVYDSSGKLVSKIYSDGVEVFEKLEDEAASFADTAEYATYKKSVDSVDKYLDAARKHSDSYSADKESGKSTKVADLSNAISLAQNANDEVVSNLEKLGLDLSSYRGNLAQTYLDTFSTVNTMIHDTLQYGDKQSEEVMISRAKQYLERFKSTLGDGFEDVENMANVALARLNRGNLYEASVYTQNMQDSLENTVKTETARFDDARKYLVLASEQLKQGNYDFAQSALENAFEVIDDHNQKYKSFFADVKETTDLGVKEVIDGNMIIYKNYSDVIDNELTPIFYGIGKNTSEAYIKGAEDGFDDQSIEDIANKAIDTTKEVLEINSPSQVFIRIGEYCMMGFLQGFENYLDTMKETTGNVGETAISGFDTVADSFALFANKMQSGELEDFTIHPRISPVLEMDNDTADLGQLMTGEALLKVNGVMIEGIDLLYTLMERSIDVSKDNTQIIVEAIRSTKEDINNLQTAISNMKITLDKKKVVGEIYSDINSKMGRDNQLKARGI